MPTVQELVGKVRKKYPTGASDSDIVTLMDTWQKRIFRKCKIPTSVTFDIYGEASAYEVGIKAKAIFDVLINGYSYQRKQLTGGSTEASRYYTFLEDYLIIHPTPTSDGEMTVYHYVTPASLSSTEMDKIPELDEDFHDMLMYGACKELAENDQRYDVASGFAVQFEDLEKELNEVFQVTPEIETIQVESGW